jgi:hypothetical protein
MRTGLRQDGGMKKHILCECSGTYGNAWLAGYGGNCQGEGMRKDEFCLHIAHIAHVGLTEQGK